MFWLVNSEFGIWPPFFCGPPSSPVCAWTQSFSLILISSLIYSNPKWSGLVLLTRTNNPFFGIVACCPSPLQMSLSDFPRFKSVYTGDLSAWNGGSTSWISLSAIWGNAPLMNTRAFQGGHGLAGRDHKHTFFNSWVNYPGIKVLSEICWPHREGTDVVSVSQ